jgi:hypothetical protein
MKRLRDAWHQVGAPLSALISAAVLGLSVLGPGGGTPVLSAVAHDCGSGFGPAVQRDAFNGNLHGWLGYCWANFGQNVNYYAGEDDAGAILDQQTLHLRDWNCGNITYDQTLTTWSTAILTMQTPTYWDWCGITESDVWGHETISGQFDWTFYLNF